MPPLPGWLKTGRKAGDDHWDTLSVDRWIEFAGLDDSGKQQGRVLGYVVAEGETGRMKVGKVYVGHIFGCEDEYYEHWLDSTDGSYRVERRCPLHFCGTHAGRCKEATIYRDIIHVDVFRVLDHEMIEGLSWLRDETRGRIVSYPAYVAQGPAAPGTSGPGGGGQTDGGGPRVDTGLLGIEGLAGALGAGVGGTEDLEEPAPSKKKKRRREDVAEDAETDGGHSPDNFAAEIAKRKPQAPVASALELTGGSGDKKKKKKKKKDDETDTSSSGDTSDE